MENASKALLIAGGILLAVLTVSVLILVSNSITSLNNANNNKELVKQLTAFNRQYESYNKKLLYGVDIITVVNKAIENNRHMDTILDPENKHYVNVIINIKGTDEAEIIKYGLETDEIGDSELSVFKNLIFTCSGIEYKEGRVHQITFTEK